MSDITKEELQAMIEVQGKTATQLESIANSLNTTTETQKEILKEVQEVTQHFTNCNMCRKTVGQTGKDVALIKWILTGSGVVIAIGVLILKLIHH